MVFGMEWDYDRGELLLRRRVLSSAAVQGIYPTTGDGYVTAWCPIFDVGPTRGYYELGPRPVTIA